MRISLAFILGFFIFAITTRASDAPVDEALAKRSIAVVRVWRHIPSLTLCGRGKFVHDLVRVVKVFKDDSGNLSGGQDFEVWSLANGNRIPKGHSTIYLEKYNPITEEYTKNEKDHWVLSGGDASTSVRDVDPNGKLP
jgi:hypothetical protein